ncbi:hypothetical protein Xen7305DRAFT_00017710 [Xenococcus sp. PCC 7305]|nr:hypothetical protein Xen7305DRAFT_00017710 [Xenococcus sp. PCC 7305]
MVTFGDPPNLSNLLQNIVQIIKIAMQFAHNCDEDKKNITAPSIPLVNTNHR